MDGRFNCFSLTCSSTWTLPTSRSFSTICFPVTSLMVTFKIQKYLLALSLFTVVDYATTFELNSKSVASSRFISLHLSAFQKLHPHVRTIYVSRSAVGSSNDSLWDQDFIFRSFKFPLSLTRKKWHNKAELFKLNPTFSLLRQIKRYLVSRQRMDRQFLKKVNIYNNICKGSCFVNSHTVAFEAIH